MRGDRRPALIIATVMLTGLCLATFAAAQTANPPPAAYRPGLGDLMTMTVQPRHEKLAIAGQEKNWTYANYEAHELQEAFERAARVWPQWRQISIADMMDAVIKGPLAELQQAIKARDAARYAAAYDELTGACNACHQGAGRGFVVIQVPTGAMFPDQDFRPQNTPQP